MPAATLSAQLYSLRDRLAADRDATLLRLAGIGFGHVEPFGLGAPDRTRSERSASARALRSALDAAGLSVSAVHAALPRDAAELAEECAILGTATAFVPHPRLVDGFDEDTFADPGRVDALADVLATAAEALAPHGVRLGYHNHWFEWARLPDGTTGHDRFWSRAGDRLAAEVDLYWAAAGGAEPAAVLSNLGDRVLAVHLKDGPAEPGAPQTPLGSGAVDVVTVLREHGGIGWHVAEIDTTELDPFDLLEVNATTLVEAGLSRW
ncbi:sugar phosphate isomerase/epimerase [Saccharopolyspora erythraea NRRL 2338]|uniref:Sugar phosphate isomerase/epimerase n=2 Tax=Saccharopolyspora erythraea TaxID=1836 RepID=A4FEQ7_SACEN|nr:TIM barrel protein [Saccharopolyspora erythraea]EQD83191.1 sugar phosphate isomerase [Saccharopolyspora erythraea D]PFG96256.1 sugar phosphate isomerase/epimerase [Saccharopolyspora erythraea NRRL 2338]QRK92777.1 TIM barrel protein [Saccharopolyspora erythraea]CAM02532.1 sugar phosphate isomerase/epimerase [Saccharopolyspora erythraea NRRL 2338]